MLQQVSIYAENKKGTLEKITGILVEQDVNILGSVTNETSEYGIIRMVVSDPAKAETALKAEGYMVRMTPVLGVEVADEVGSLNRVLTALRESNISVDYAYLSFNRESGKPIMILHCEDCDEVEENLMNKGFILD